MARKRRGVAVWFMPAPMDVRLTVDSYPKLALVTFVSELPKPMGELVSPSWLVELLRLDVPVPISSNDSIRSTIRDLFRHGGFKPTGRSKPASEYLVRSASEGKLGSINVAVDVCNAVSLHSGIPISVIDLDRARPPLRVGAVDKGTSYVFNAAGQTIDVGGLVCLFDAEGPCANAVKDAQRIKTNAETRRTLTLMWGSEDVRGQTERARAWYVELLGRLDVRIA